ncbi:MAG: hypothetical protein HY470_01240 [Candidatus Ryanbacteria bacterium]|nr:hypothetical protein [Candidatus Ryanbacteria bacterium]
MTKRRRRVLFWSFVLIFLAAILPILFYSFGYRFSWDEFKFVRAGGLLVTSTPATGVKIYVDGKFIHETSLISRRAYLAGLTPRAYHIHIERDGYYPWDKALIVEPEKVASAEAILVKKEEPRLLLKGAFDGVAFYDGSEEIISLLQKKKRTLFSLDTGAALSARPPRTASATSSAAFLQSIQPVLADKKPSGFDADEPSRILWWDKSTLWVKWLEGEDRLPLYTEEIERKIFEARSPIRDAAFYPDQEAVLVATDTDILVIELDGRVWRNKQAMYTGASPRFVVSPTKKELYLVDNGSLYLIALL